MHIVLYHVHHVQHGHPVKQYARLLLSRRRRAYFTCRGEPAAAAVSAAGAAAEPAQVPVRESPLPPPIAKVMPPSVAAEAKRPRGSVAARAPRAATPVVAGAKPAGRKGVAASKEVVAKVAYAGVAGAAPRPVVAKVAGAGAAPRPVVTKAAGAAKAAPGSEDPAPVASKVARVAGAAPRPVVTKVFDIVQHQPVVAKVAGAAGAAGAARGSGDPAPAASENHPEVAPAAAKVRRRRGAATVSCFCTCIMYFMYIMYMKYMKYFSCGRRLNLLSRRSGRLLLWRRSRPCFSC